MNKLITDIGAWNDWFQQLLTRKRFRSAAPVWRYGSAILLTAMAILLRYVLFPVIGQEGPYIFIFPAIIITAVLGGLGPAMLTSALGVLGTEIFFVGPLGIHPNVSTLLRIVMILLSGMLLGYIGYALRESEWRLHGMFSHAAMGIAEVDTEGRFVAVNEYLCRILGYRREQLLGMNVHALTHPEDRSLSDDLNARLYAGELTQLDYEKRYLKADGSPLWVHVTVSPVRDVHGRPLRAIGTIEDITERKRVESELVRAKQEWERTFDSVPDLITVLDRDHRIIRANRAMAARLKLAPEACVGLTCYECIHGCSLPPAACPHERLLDDFKEHAVEVHEERLGGDFLVTATPLCDETGRIVGSVHVARDITERKRAEEALRQLSEELEQRVAERTAQLRAAVEELRRSNEDLEKFAYISSHDLQEPLRMVASYVQLLEMRYKDKLDDRAGEYIHFAAEGAQRMSNLIKDLLAYSRVNTQGRPPEPTSAEQALDAAVGNLHMAIAETGAEITRDPLPTIPADPTQLAQVFQNLIGNAIKFRNDNEPPRIHVSAETRDGQWLFRVHDNGIGIEPEYHEQIFLPFKRLHANRRKYPGSGIGLAIVKRVIERHHGRITVESRLGEGTTFCFTMPASLGSASLPHGELQAERQLPRATPPTE